MNIEFSEKQIDMLNLPQKTWNIFGGAVRSGKSHGTMYRMPINIMTHYNHPCLLVAKTLAVIERNILRPLRSMYGEYDVGDIRGRADGGRYVSLWGKEVDCVGANDDRAISKIHGAEYGFVYCDELTLYPENFFRMLQSRLSLPNASCDATCNPDSPSHYIKQFLDSQNFDGNYVHFTIYDNPFLPAAYVKRLENEYRGTIYFERWILGNWVRTEGLVFPLFKREKHYLLPSEYTKLYRNGANKIKFLIVGGDGATTNDATSLVPLAVFEDGTSVVLDIFYHNPKTNGQLSNAELVVYIAKWYEDIIDKYNLNSGYVQFYTAMDCAAADLVLTMRKNLPDNYNITGMTKKSITQTTDVVNNAFGRNAVHILNMGGCFNYVRGQFETRLSPLVVELETMIWDKDNAKYDDSVPNDAADAFRYAVATYYNNPDNLWETPGYAE